MAKIIEASGILDGSKGAQLRSEIATTVDQGQKTVLVDLKAVSFIDSSGLGALVASLKSVRAAGAELYLCSISDQVQMLFDLTSMDQVFKILPSQDEFLSVVNAGAGASLN